MKYKLTEKYALEHRIAVKVSFNASRGFHLTIPANNSSAIPSIFIQAVQNARSVSCTTAEIMSLSDRAAENIAMALTITQQLIQDALAGIRKHIEILFNIADAIVSSLSIY
jgi:DNA mismatch repair ATPase MutS